VTGSYGWSIVIFSLVVKLLLYYPTQKQYQSMRDMQLIQPEIKRLQEKYKDDQERLAKEQMALFQKHKVNPLGGCLPMFAQMPILYGIYGAIRKIFQVTVPLVPPPAEKWMWIGTPLAKQFPHFLAASFDQPDGLLVLLYGFSMLLSQRLTITQTSDPAQVKQQKMMNTLMPIFFTYMMWQWHMPSALLFYWFMFNIFNAVQQVHIVRQVRTTAPPPAKAA
jgi:YidC/Oxa1 family membrane protein insertase